MTDQPVTTLHVAFYGIDAGDGRLSDLIDRIDRWSEDNLGIEEPPHSFDTHRVPVSREAREDVPVFDPPIVCVNCPPRETGGEG
jgi:hypothetical protein